MGQQASCRAESYAADVHPVGDRGSKFHSGPSYANGGPFFNISPDAVAPVRFAEEGPASAAMCPSATLPALLSLAAERSPNSPALVTESNTESADSEPRAQWSTVTWGQYKTLSEQAARALVSYDFPKNGSVIFFGFNATPILVLNMAAMLAGGKSTGIYITDGPDYVGYKTRHSASTAVLVEDSRKLKVVEDSDIGTQCKVVIMYGEKPAKTSFTSKSGHTVEVISWDDFLAKGAIVDGANAYTEEVTKRTAELQPGQCCYLIYTSGTTGYPKSVMCSHDNLVFMSNLIRSMVPTLGAGGQERCISFLPLSHIAALMVDQVVPLLLTSRCAEDAFATTYFARSNDLKVGTLGKRLTAIQPTYFFAVPRVYEKIEEKLKEVGKATTGVQKTVATWAKGLAHHKNINGQMNGNKSSSMMFPVASALLKKVQVALGLDQCKITFTGAAPISRDTLEYFASLGIVICEVYGMSECCGATTGSNLAFYKFGCAGYGMPGVETRIFRVDEKDFSKKTIVPFARDVDHATEEEQGEICFRGRHIMIGYMANKDLGEEHVAEMQKKTAETIDSEGWLHSGDKGAMSADGFLKITGRYKELIIGAGGENVAPVPVENEIKKQLPAISNVVMIGDKKKFNTVLVTLKCRGANGELAGTTELIGDALEVDPEAKTVADAQKSEKWRAYIEAGVKLANKNAASNASCVQKFRILDHDLSVEGEEFTSTLKLKRHVVATKYASVIDTMYQGDE